MITSRTIHSGFLGTERSPFLKKEKESPSESARATVLCMWDPSCVVASPGQVAGSLHTVGWTRDGQCREEESAPVPRGCPSRLQSWSPSRGLQLSLRVLGPSQGTLFSQAKFPVDLPFSSSPIVYELQLQKV